MSIIQKLTLLYLKENKKQTLITIIGVILSVTMITAVATSCVSFLDLLRRQAIEREGNWHVLYEGIPSETLSILIDDKNTKKAFITSRLGHALIEESYNTAKPYFEVLAFSEDNLEAYPITIIEGQFPKDSTEILVTKSVMNASNLDLKLGDTLTIEVGQRARENGKLINPKDPYYNIFPEQITNTTSYTFTIVGFISESDSTILSGPSYPLITALDDSVSQRVSNLTVALQLHQLDSSLYSHTTSLIDGDEVIFNRELLRYFGITNHSDVNLMLYALATFFTILIMIASVSLIYNAFSISVAKRTKHLGMLASAGATRAQKRLAILFEGFIVGLISIPLGLLFGTIGMGITFHLINPFLKIATNSQLSLNLVISPTSIWIAILVSSLTILISAWIPAYRASKVPPIVAIRQNKDIKLSRKSVKSSKWISFLFGIEGDLALKNIKRQRRRYYSTIFSLALSLVLFLVTTSFLDQLQHTLSLIQSQKNYDIALYGDNPIHGYAFGGNTQTLLVDEILTLDTVRDYNLTQTLSLAIDLPLDKLNAQYQTYLNEHHASFFNKSFTLDVIGIRDDLFIQYVSDEMNIKPDGVPLIVLNKAIFRQKRNQSELRLFDTLPNVDVLDSSFDSYDFEIIGLMDEYPIGIDPSSPGYKIPVITMFSLVEQLMNEVQNVGGSNLGLYLVSDTAMVLEQEIIDLYLEKGLPTPNIINFEHYQQSNQQLLTVISIFSTGFISLMTLISLVNTINTLTTNIGLRIREFSILRSTGMDPNSFHKMICFESLFYGLKALLFGLPISLILIIFIHLIINTSFAIPLILPWNSVSIAVVITFIFIWLCMKYSMSQVRRINLIDGLKHDN